MSEKERVKRNLNTAEALTMYQDLESGDSDGGDPSEFGEDSDLSWAHENTSSESDRVCTEEKEATSPGGYGLKRSSLPEPALEPTGVLSPPLLSSQPEAAVEKGKDGTVWMVLQPDGRPGRRQSQNVVTEAAGPTAQAKRNVEDSLTAFLCVFDDEFSVNSLASFYKCCSGGNDLAALAENRETSSGCLVRVFLCIFYNRKF